MVNIRDYALDARADRIRPVVSVFRYWRSVLGEAFAKTKTDVIGKTLADIVRDFAVLGLAFTVARWVLHSQNVANESIVWTLSVVLAFGGLFLFVLAYNLVAVPARREQRLDEKIKVLEPDLPTLTAVQEAVLRACNVVSPNDEHWLKNNVAKPTIDGTSFRQGYDYTKLKCAIENLEKNGLAQVITKYQPGIYEMSFSLKPELINAMRKRGLCD